MRRTPEAYHDHFLPPHFLRIVFAVSFQHDISPRVCPSVGIAVNQCDSAYCYTVVCPPRRRVWAESQNSPGEGKVPESGFRAAD